MNDDNNKTPKWCKGHFHTGPFGSAIRTEPPQSVSKIYILFWSWLFHAKSDLDWTEEKHNIEMLHACVFYRMIFTKIIP